MLAAFLATAPLAAWAAPGAAVLAAAPAHDPIDARLAAAKDAMMGDPQAALTLAAEASALAQARGGPRQVQAVASAQWLQGEALLRLHRAGEAAPLIDAGLAAVSAQAPDSKLHGDLLMTHAALEAERGQVQNALRDYQTAYRIFGKAGQPRGQAVALQNIGSIYQDAHDPEKVLHYYALSAEAYPADLLLRLSAANNIGNALMTAERYGRAGDEFERALQIARQMGSAPLEARILCNLALAEAQSGKLDAAKAHIDRAAALVRTLPNAQEAERSLAGASAQVELARGRPRETVRLLAPLFAGRDLKTTGVSYADLHRTAYRAYRQLGDARMALTHLEAFKRLDDQGQTLAASTNAALMAAQFDYANQASRIAQLKAGQLERDVKLARSRNIVVTLLLACSLLVAAVLAAAMLGVRRSRNLARAANRRLRETNLLLEKALRVRTEFLANISHELRTPLNGVLGMTEVVLAQPDLAPDLRERIAVTHAGAETLRALVDDILDLARIETDGVTLHRDVLDLPKLCREAVQMWSDKAAAKGLALTCAVEDAPGRAAPQRIVEDAGRLRQILFVLLSNAVKFTGRGEVRLSAGVENAEVGERLVLKVSDTGAGVPSEKRAEVFEPFRQADSSRTRAHGGAGLGLAICRRLVDAMGGEIVLDSAVGRGTTVTVTLPLTRASGPKATGAAIAPAAAPTLRTRALLLCDANPLSLSVLKAVLRPQLGQVEAVGSREDALEAALGRGFDLAVIDAVALGETSGARLAALTALCDALTPARTVVLLAEDAADQTDALRAAGAARIVRKPITAAALIDALTALIEDPGTRSDDAKTVVTA
jgi:signal transduction histidine kinase